MSRSTRAARCRILHPAPMADCQTACGARLVYDGIARSPDLRRRLYRGLSSLWGRQIPYTMMKFASFEKTVVALYE